MGQQHFGSIVYSQDHLMLLRLLHSIALDWTQQIPKEIRKKFQEWCGKGSRTRPQKDEAWTGRSHISTLIMGDVLSLANKMEALTALTRYQKEFKECSVMCFTESWLHQVYTMFPSRAFRMRGQTETTPRAISEKEGGLLFLLITNGVILVKLMTKERMWCLDIELLAVGLHLYYLPREMSHAIVMAICVPSSANSRSACKVLHTTIAGLKTKTPKYPHYNFGWL